MARQTFCLSLLVVMVEVLNNGVAQQCIVSRSSIFGWMLQRHVYRTMMAERPHLCLYACREDNRCQSFNFVLSLRMCELNNRTNLARPQDFIPNPDRLHFTRGTSRVSLGTIPELPAESCEEIKASEGEKAVSGKYWFDSIEPGNVTLAYCNMAAYNMSTEECQNYKVLNTKGRKSSFKSNSAFCDDGKYGWYRFKGRAGTKMAGTCVPAGRCNTKAQGWLEGAHPGVRDGQVTRKVCFNYDSNCCHWSVDIQVRNCGDFFVYLLSGTPDCELRYCGED